MFDETIQDCPDQIKLFNTQPKAKKLPKTHEQHYREDNNYRRTENTDKYCSKCIHRFREGKHLKCKNKGKSVFVDEKGWTCDRNRKGD